MINPVGQKIVVTGAAGFLGQHLMRRLIAAGSPVHAILLAGDDEERFFRLNLPVPYSIIQTPNALGEAAAQLQPTHVVHLGAVIDNRPTLEAVRRTLDANFLSTVALLEALVATSVQRVILLGSCEEYGNNPTPFQTSAAVDPMTPYAASKSAVAAYARMFHSAFGLGTVVIRPAVIYGFGQNPRMLISDVMSSLENGHPVAVSPGAQQRDFIYVSDMVALIEKALTAPGIDGLILNAGTGTTTTVRECIQHIIELTGRTGLVEWGGRTYSKNELFQYAPDCSRTESLLNWKAAVGLREGLSLMLEEMRAFRQTQLANAVEG